MIADPRQIYVNGHQEFWTGWFHGWTEIHEAGLHERMAVVEGVDGCIQLVRPHKVKFLHPLPKVPA